jgi:hypothetical protein
MSSVDDSDLVFGYAAPWPSLPFLLRAFRRFFLIHLAAAARLHFLHCPLALMFAGRISCPFLHFLYAMMMTSDFKIPWCAAVLSDKNERTCSRARHAQK